MLDLNIPAYVWITFTLVMLFREFRQWVDMIVEYDKFEQEFKHQCVQDEKDDKMSDAVKRMFS